MKLREFEVGDYESVKDIWLKGKPGIGRIDTLEQVKKKLERDPDLFLVAETGGVIVGTVLGAWDGRRGWVYHLAVLPARRRSGVASKLLGEVEGRLKRKGARRVNAMVLNSNRPSLAFFKQMGYQSDEALTLHGKDLTSE